MLHIYTTQAPGLEQTSKQREVVVFLQILFLERNSTGKWCSRNYFGIESYLYFMYINSAPTTRSTLCISVLLYSAPLREGLVVHP